MPYRAGFLALALGLVSGPAAAQQPCQQIRFAPGTSAGIVEGLIPPDGTLCYTVEVGNGQRAEASITGPEAQFPVFSIPGLTKDGGEQSFAWTTRAGTYDIYVTTLFRYGANTPFRLRLSVTGG
ncbi:MAG: hypothetical protein ACT4OK_02005 [Gemmobacter sp.]